MTDAGAGSRDLLRDVTAMLVDDPTKVAVESFEEEDGTVVLELAVAGDENPSVALRRGPGAGPIGGFLGLTFALQASFAAERRADLAIRVALGALTLVAVLVRNDAVTPEQIELLPPQQKAQVLALQQQLVSLQYIAMGCSLFGLYNGSKR